MRTVAIGVAVGVVLAFATGQLLSSMLFGVEPNDLSAMLFSACALLLVAGAAAVVPAWRASRVDPMSALRTE
jgi:putative ABC transport system permease protein